MVKLGQPLSAATRGVFAAVAVTAALGLAACGSTVAGGSHAGTSGSGTNSGARKSAVQPGGPMMPAGTTPANLSVCTHVTSLVRLTVVRNTGMVKERNRPQAAGIIVTNASEVRKLAATLCGLPSEPPVMNCPADFGTGYRLAFASATKAFELVTVQTSGCRTVSGMGKARSWARSPQVGTVVRQTIDSGSALLPSRSGGTPAS
jgi:hypothetical protein